MNQLTAPIWDNEYFSAILSMKTLPDSEKIGVVTSGSVEKVQLEGYTENSVKTFDSLKFIGFERQ